MYTCPGCDGAGYTAMESQCERCDGEGEVEELSLEELRLTELARSLQNYAEGE